MLGHIRRTRDGRDRRRVLRDVEPQAVALGWDIFGPLITEMATALHSFNEAELATVRRFLLTIADVVEAGRAHPRNAG